jgi:hypothetical protein
MYNSNQSTGHLSPEQQRKVKSDMLRALLIKMESKPHISDELFLRVLGVSREKIYLKCPWLRPEVRNQRQNPSATY